MYFFSTVRCVAVCTLLLSLFCPPCAVAEDEFFVSLAGRVSVTPYKSYDTQWTPLPMVGYESKYAYVRGYTAGFKMINLDFVEFSVFGGYDGTSFDPADSSDKRLRRLSDRYSSAVAGLDLRLRTPYGMLHASGAQDVLGNSNGRSGTIGYMNSLEYGDLELIPSVGLQWSDRKYNDYYYGVSNNEAYKSGLEPYDSGSGFSPYVGLTIGYSLTEAWEFFCNCEFVFLNNAVKDSPMVGRTNTYSFTAGFSYTF
jgi:Outer membrane protein V